MIITTYSEQHKLRKEFVKAYRLPIQVLQDPYFPYLIDLYDGNFNTAEKYFRFLNSLEDFENIEDFFSARDKLINDIISFVKRTIEYNNFVNDSNIPLNQIKTKNIYNIGNNLKEFYSLDIKSANFNVLQHYYQIFPQSDYQSFVSEFTSNNFLKESKYIRQMIFGHLNPKRQRNLQKHYLDKIYHEILDQGFNSENIIRQGSDEIIIENKNEKGLEEFLEKLELESEIPLELSKFKIELIDDEKEVFMKRFLDSNYFELVNAPGHFHPQYFKICLNQEISDYDLVFYHDGKLAKFLETVG